MGYVLYFRGNLTINPSYLVVFPEGYEGFDSQPSSKISFESSVNAGVFVEIP